MQFQARCARFACSGPHFWSCHDSVPNTSGIRPDIRFVVQANAVDAHLFDVQLHIARPAAQQLLSLPVWIPGSYLVREFSKNLQGLKSHAERPARGRAATQQNQWKIACNADAACVVSYQVCAYDTSVRTAWLDRRRGFFNGTSLCLRVHGKEDHPHALELLGSPATEDWQAATGLKPAQVDANGFGLYQAAHYDELVDCPVEMGRFWRGSFRSAACPMNLSSPVPRPALMASACWPIRKRSAKPRSPSGMPTAASRPWTAMSSCSMWWMTTMAASSTATARH
jgi:hypothetical protein